MARLEVMLFLVLSLPLLTGCGSKSAAPENPPGDSAAAPGDTTPTSAASDAPQVAAQPEVGPALRFTMASLRGDGDINFAERYAGKVVLFVNVASKCGFTPQYEILEALDARYGDQGLEVVGIPCNQFMNQEPGTAEEIIAFCEETYQVTFDMVEKSDVNGENATELYQYLTSVETSPEPAGPISWNFEKFLVDRSGNVVARYAPGLAPDEAEVIAAIEAELAENREEAPTAN
jgi:glutathione peroxidase